MLKTAFNWKVAGAAGEGIKTTGMMFSKVCLRSGLYTFDYTEYPSLIRGGHNTYQVIASIDKVTSPEKPVDLLIALNQNAVNFHSSEIAPEGMMIFDGHDERAVNIPFVELAKKAGGEKLMANNVALGVSMYLLSLDLTILDQVIADIFAGKKPEIISLNQNASHAGYDYAKAHLKPLSHLAVRGSHSADNLSLTGNEALALGAVAGGMKAYIAYPMTPSSSILHQLADWQEKANIFVKHAEDEIGVINMALGMSFAGVRVAVGTSGGGYCYMTEAVGLSGVAELPLVIFESMRPGPALGMPTWTAQGDLLFVIFSSQDEFPRIVLAPGDVKEAFDQSKLAFDLAEDYQLPVIILSDKHLSESSESLHLDQTTFSHLQTSFKTDPIPDETGFFRRYEPDDDGISLRSIPGQKGGLYLSNSYEHDVHGLGSETAKDRLEQMSKRMKKLEIIKHHLPKQFYFGSSNPQITFFGYGSTKGALLAGAKALIKQGIDAAVYNLSWVWPFPTAEVTDLLNRSRCPVIVEGNSTNQLAKLVRQETGIDIYHKRTKYDGRPFYPDEIVQYAHEILGV
jgi:2-oxoglutarate/2-oxoacid ferredoxin oxidoreductase subunit alpha